MTKISILEDKSGNGGYDDFELSAGGVVYNKSNDMIRLLLLTRHDGLITLPKGHIEKREELRKTALREIQEETSLPIDNLQIQRGLGWYPNPILVHNGKRIFKLVFYFLIQYKNDVLPTLTTDCTHQSANWYSLEDIPNLRLAYSHIKHVINKAKISILEAS
ncbi:NUDIX domain-containing protein [Candidatus Poribacteria bacterium]|nr:NUDIX domain-containing protein [Candidatus Poribacteria bacterium]